MTDTKARIILKDVYNFLQAAPTPEQIVAYQEPEDIQGRLGWLLAQRRTRTLTRSEQAELDLLIETEHYLRRLKYDAQMQLALA